jgi:hypothetical protein
MVGGGGGSGWGILTHVPQTVSYSDVTDAASNMTPPDAVRSMTSLDSWRASLVYNTYTMHDNKYPPEFRD